MNKRTALFVLAAIALLAGIAAASTFVPATPVSISWDQYVTHESVAVPHAYIEYRLVPFPPANPLIVCAEQEVDTGLDAFDAPGSGEILIPTPAPWDMDAVACSGLLEEQSRLVWRIEDEPPIYGLPLPDQTDRGDGWIAHQVITGPQELPLSGLVAGNDGPTPLGEPTTLTARIAAGTGITYTWIFGDGQGGTGAAVEHVYPAVGNYSAVVTASNSLNSLTATTEVTIVEVPIAGLVADNDGPTPLGETTTLTASVGAGTGVTYAWAFGDGQNGAGAAVEHVYPAMGSYSAVVTASNSINLMVTSTTVTVGPPAQPVYLPLILRLTP